MSWTAEERAVRYRRTFVALLAIPALVACRPTPREVFETDVVRVFEARCLSSGCHGVAPGAEARGEQVDGRFFYVRTRADGRVQDVSQAYATAKGRIDTREAPELSTLLRKPLDDAPGGLSHFGGRVFASREDPGWKTIRDWIASETGGGEGVDPESLTREERFFGENVLPVLAARQCMNGACHSGFAPFTSFEPPVEVDGKRLFSAASVRANHHAARMHLNLAGDPMLSRLLRKALPIVSGGIQHRGGNAAFFGSPDDPGGKAIRQWIELERAAAGLPEVPQVTGLVFVRGPAAPEDFESLDAFVPGSDLYAQDGLEPGAPARNLTAAAHAEGPADVRDPAISHDARRVAFSMRRSAADAHNIYLIDLDGTNLRQLTHDRAALPGGGVAANVQPAWGPDGRIYFASTRAGRLADGLQKLDSDIWAVDPASGALEQWTHDPAPELTPSFIPTGKSYGTLSFTMIRRNGGRFEGPVFRGPLDHNRAYHGDAENHIHHGVTLGGRALYGMRTLPDGRFVAIVLEPGDAWKAGILAVFDRQFGPEMPASDEPKASLGGYRHAFTMLAGGEDGQRFRHPVPLPDGRLLVSVARSDSPEFSLNVATLAEEPATGRPRLASLAPLLEDARDAEPIVRRPLEDDPSHVADWDRTRMKTTGNVAFRHVETLEALFTDLAPRGPKELRSDLAYVRFLEAVPPTPAELATAPVGLSGQLPQRILGEVPLVGGSVSVDVPADRPFRTQFLNSERMAVGTQHNRWTAVAPGEHFPGGVSPKLFPTLCGGCHGALSGEAGDLERPVPDVITSASITPATHRDGDPRLPLPPERLNSPAISVDFVHDVGPVLARSCTKCHAGEKAAGGLDLTSRATARFDTAYEALLASGEGSGHGRRWIDDIGSSAFSSHFVERIEGRELGAPKTLTGKCTGEPPLTDAEKLLLVRWIDLGAPYRGAPR